MWEVIGDERRGLASLLESLTDVQLDTPSLVPTWTVRDVAGHLGMVLDLGLLRFLVATLTSGGIVRAVDKISHEYAQRPIAELATLLRRNADSRFGPPGSTVESGMAELLVHGLDMRRPVGIAREIPEERARMALRFLTETPARGFVGKGWRDGLRFEATNFGWSHGQGALVRGHSDFLLLAITGRRAVLAELEGDGVAVLRDRFGPG